MASQRARFREEARPQETPLPLAALVSCWAAAHQRFREPKAEEIDLSGLMPGRSSAAAEQFINAVYNVATIDRWKEDVRDERMNALTAAGVINKDTLEFYRNFTKNK